MSKFYFGALLARVWPFISVIHWAVHLRTDWNVCDSTLCIWTCQLASSVVMEWNCHNIRCCGSYILNVTSYSYRLHFLANNLLQLQCCLKVSSYFCSYFHLYWFSPCTLLTSLQFSCNFVMNQLFQFSRRFYVTENICCLKFNGIKYFCICWILWKSHTEL